MIRVNEKLTVYHDNNSVFLDRSNVLVDFTRGTAVLDYTQGEDSLYVGFKKPINVFYAEFSTVSTEDATMTVKYYNGSSFADVDGLYDDTDGFKRSGFVRWNRGLTGEVATTVNSVELYWYKIDFDVNTSLTTELSGLNIVFADDQDLKREVHEISKFLPSGESSHILSHVAARDEVIQNLNIMGKNKKDGTSGWLEDISSFDLLDVSEAKLAATYLALHKIYLASSDDLDDIHGVKAFRYRDMADNILNTMSIKIDYDDDGKYDRSEREPASITQGTIKRQ